MTVTVTLNPAATASTVIPIEVTPWALAGWAAETADFTVSGLGTGGNLTFASGDSTKTFTVDANDDTGTQLDDVELDFGTLPTGVTSPRASETYRAVIRILDDDWVIRFSLREDQPSDRRFLSSHVVNSDSAMRDFVWWLGGPDAASFRITSDNVAPNLDYGRIWLRDTAMLDPDVKLKYSFYWYYSDGAETSGVEAGCVQGSPATCRPDYRSEADMTVTHKPEISIDPPSFPANETTDAVLTLTYFMTPSSRNGTETVGFTVNDGCAGFLEFATPPPTITIDATGAGTVPVSLTPGPSTGNRPCAIVATGTRLRWGRFDTAEAPLTVNGPPPVGDPDDEEEEPESAPVLPGFAVAVLAAILLWMGRQRT